MRMLVLWCPDWPITAAGYGVDSEVVICRHSVVATASASARAAGVQLGMRRRVAQQHCSDLVVLAHNASQEQEQFQPIVTALMEVTSSLEVIRPGLCALDMRGPSRYLGGEDEVVRRTIAAVSLAMPQLSAPPVRIGIAEGQFAAVRAAHRGVIVPPDGTPAFLADLPITTLGDRTLTDALCLLGITTLGAFADLPSRAVSARFGSAGVLAHVRARGQEHDVVQPTPISRVFDAGIAFEIPLKRTDATLFATRTAAEGFIATLFQHGLSCVRVVIAVETEHGEICRRVWRAEYVFDADEVMDRLRWQLDGWLSGTTVDPVPSAGIVMVRFLPDEVIAFTGRQHSLFGGITDRDLRAMRGADRLAGLLGPGRVFTASVAGGRTPIERSLLVPWGETSPEPNDTPWPGRHPTPAPTVIYLTPIPITVTDAKDAPVVVSSRGLVSSAPAVVVIAGKPGVITGWSAPWLFDERHWQRGKRSRRARFQLLLDDGSAHLCFIEHSCWFLEATYD